MLLRLENESVVDAMERLYNQHVRDKLISETKKNLKLMYFLFFFTDFKLYVITPVVAGWLNGIL